MALANNEDKYLEWLKFKESSTVPGQVGVVVVNPDGTAVAGGGAGGQEYTDGAAAPANPIGKELVFKNGATMAAVTAALGLPVNVVAGAAGGGVANTQVRSGANAWTDVGYFTGNLNMPVQAADGGIASIGTTTDAATLSTVIGRLKALVNLYPAAAALADTTANPTLTQISAYPMGYNGTTWDRLKATAGSLNVHLDAQTVAVSGTFWQATQPVSGTVTTTPPANASTNVAQLAGTATSVNSGVKDAGTLRVVLATDQPALTNKLLVTPDSVALPANQSVNVSQINAVTPLMGNGVTGTGSQRVTIASDNTAFTVNAAQSGTWTVQPGNTQNTTAWLVGAIPATSGGLTMHSRLLTADTNLVSVKASAGQIYAIQAFGTGSAPYWLKLYNKASAPVIASDSALIVKRILVPANATAANGSGVTINLADIGSAFSTGIAYACTGLQADADTTATAAAGAVNLDYK